MPLHPLLERLVVLWDGADPFRREADRQGEVGRTPTTYGVHTTIPTEKLSSENTLQGEAGGDARIHFRQGIMAKVHRSVGNACTWRT